MNPEDLRLPAWMKPSIGVFGTGWLPLGVVALNGHRGLGASQLRGPQPPRAGSAVSASWRHHSMNCRAFVAKIMNFSTKSGKC